MEYMTTPEEFADMSTPDLRDWIREARSEYRSELSRRHMARPESIKLVLKQHDVAMGVLRTRL